METFPTGVYIFGGFIVTYKWISGYYSIERRKVTVSFQNNSLLDIVNSCESLQCYIPSPYYVLDVHGQLQTTVQCALRMLSMTLFGKLRYKRELFPCKDGGTVGLDWAYSNKTKEGGEDSSIVLIHHGLCGDSYSEYIYHLAEKLVADHYSVVVLVARGCGGVKLTTPKGFTGAHIEDIEEVVEFIKKKHPQAKLFGMGFSLGAGLMLKYLGTHPSNPLLGAVCVSPPWDFFKKTKPFPFWSAILAVFLKFYYLQNITTLSENKTPLLKVLSARNIYEFDSAVVDTFGYSDVDSYYQDASPKHRAHNIKTPTLAISAEDDPVCCVTGCPMNLGDGLVIVTTTVGGHLAFAEGLLPIGCSWVDSVTSEWFEAIASKLSKDLVVV